MQTSPETPDITQYYAAAFLVTEEGQVVGQRFIDTSGDTQTEHILPFGGPIVDEEDPMSVIWRVLVKEETNLELDIFDIQVLARDVVQVDDDEWQERQFFYALIAGDDLDRLEVYDGPGWAFIHGENDPKIADDIRHMVAELFERLALND